MLTQNVYSVGTAATTVVAPTLDAGRYILKNLEPMPEDARYARAGYVYLIDQFININSGGTANFLFETGAQGVQFEFWNFGSTSDNIRGYLIEGATIVSTGTAVPAYNMNRNKPDTYLSTIESATSITGGTVVVAELVSASKQAGGSMESGKIVTLEPETRYGFSFVNTGNQNTTLHAQIGFSENYNGYNEIWLGDVDNSYCLRGGEEVSMYLRPYEVINATALRDGCQLAVMRQD